MQDQNKNNTFPVNDPPPFGGNTPPSNQVQPVQATSDIPQATPPAQPLQTEPVAPISVTPSAPRMPTPPQAVAPIPTPSIDLGSKVVIPQQAQGGVIPQTPSISESPASSLPSEGVAPLPIANPVADPLPPKPDVLEPFIPEPPRLDPDPLQGVPENAAQAQTTLSTLKVPDTTAQATQQVSPAENHVTNDLPPVTPLPEQSPLTSSHFPEDTLSTNTASTQSPIPQSEVPSPVPPNAQVQNLPSVAMPQSPLPAAQPQSPPPASQGNSPFTSILTPAPTMPTSTAPTSVPQTVAPTPQVASAPHEVAPALVGKKGGFPKKILFAIGGILLFILLVLVVMRLMSGGGNGSLVGTKGEIEWWGLTLDEEVVTPIIEEYESEHPGINITYVKQSENEYRERLTNALASGNGPDMYEIHNSWVPMFRNDLAVLPSSVMSTDEYKSSFYPVMSTDLTTTTGVIGMPLYYDAITLYVNEDIFSSALKTAPRTWNEVITLADPVNGLSQKDAAGRIIQSGVALGTTENVDYWPEIFALMMFQENANFADLSSTKTKSVVSVYNYFKSVGAWDATLPTSTSAFAKQRTAMIFAPSSAAYGIIQEAPNLRFKTYDIPQLEKEVPTQPNVTYATYWAQGVWKRSTNSEESWKFLKYMSDPVILQKTNQSLKARNRIERAYPRPNMNQEFANHPILGSVVSLAASAKTWYLYDKTNDGKTGLNTLLKTAYAKALSGGGTDAQSQITQILTQYGLALPK